MFTEEKVLLIFTIDSKRVNNLSEKIMKQVQSLLDEYGKELSSVAYALCDSHDQSKTALYYENEKRDKKTYTYGQLNELSRKLAKVLHDLGIEKGKKVAILLPKGPELFISVLAVWRLGAVHVPLFTAFGPEAISYRVEKSGANVIITDEENRGKITSELEDSNNVKIITVTSSESDGQQSENNDMNFWHSIQNASAITNNVDVTGEDTFIILFTSGTTGNPKGVEVPVKALAAFEVYMRFGLDLRSDDVFWNIADPGWAYGLYYALIGPLLLGQSTLMLNAKFSVDDTIRILKDYEVTNFAAAPTVYRAMRAAGIPTETKGMLKLRVLSSAGEPLNPDISKWAEENLGAPIYDHYGQTELGMAINNHHFPDLEQSIRPGSMGQAMPGYRAVILDEDGNEMPPGEEGQVALDIENSPLFWFRGYYEDMERTKERFANNAKYYLTGDNGSRDADNFFYFSGRSDDIIISSGYRIGPFEVESALMKHKAVAEAAVVGVPDESRGEIVKAYIVLRSGYTPNEQLDGEIKEFVKQNLSAHEYPRLIEFVDALPKTPSGKIQRFLLRPTK